MVIFISGSINSGKTTTAKALAKRLGVEFLDIDDVNDKIPNFDLSKDLEKSIKLGMEQINELTSSGKSVIVSYPLRQEDYEQLQAGIDDHETYYITLSPKIEVAQSDRGRRLTDWEIQRIKYHYNSGIATPAFGSVIDSSDLTLDEVVEKIVDLIDKK